ncbi:MAG: hypothetical protein KAT05_08435 [Spirochaetes bacterium]|nr:hypothetical protein [Spirochaetota bacterium]
MPAHNDLKILKNKIQNIGDEVEILQKNKLPLNDTPTPEEIEPLDDETSEDTENLLGEIIDDFKQGHIIEEDKDSLDIDDLSINIDEDLEPKIEPADQITEPPQDIEKIEETTDISDTFDDIEDIKEEEEEPYGADELSALLDNIGSTDTTTETQETFDDQISTPDVDKSEKSEPSIKVDDALADLAGNFEDTEPTDKIESSEVDDVLEQLGKEAESYSDLKELDSLLGEQELAEPITRSEEKDDDLESLLATPHDENFASPGPLEDKEDIESILEEPIIPEEISDIEKLSEMEELVETEPISEDKGLSDLEDLSLLEPESIGEELAEKLPEGDGGFGDFDIENLESFSPENIEEISPEISEEEVETAESKGIDYIDYPKDKPPEELSKEDIKANKDISIMLSDNERKQIVISLTSLPKEAEIKISKAIISGKYSNAQLKPLLDALIEKESPHAIIQYYEKITGDKSLAHIEAVKYTGERFEELQKSFAYIFQKNVLPILSIIASASVVLLAIVVIFIRLLLPTWQATKYYNIGKENIEKKIFWDVENNFKRAYDIQPRYSELVDYARKYRKYKRYLKAEKKYDMAYNLKPYNQKIALEYADFFREIKNYERAEKRYKALIKSDEKNLNAILGLAKTYTDWSEEEKNKIENAKETYLDALDIDKNNKEAIYGKLNIYLKEKNHKQIMIHYNYIERKFKTKVDPIVYANLAEYLIDVGKIDNIKKVLERASASARRKDYLPEIDYQYARYKKFLMIFNEEKAHLEKALRRFKKMKKNQFEKYESPKYQNLLSRVYNDLGENYNRSSKANTQAEKYYLKSIQANPYNGKPYYNLANFALKYKPNGYVEAKSNYLEAEQKGFKNNRLDFNLSWLYYKEKDYYNSYKRVANLLDKYPDNSNLKFMTGTIFYKLGKYELSESMLLETYIHFANLSQQYYPLDVDNNEDLMIMNMIKKVSNNLGAAYQKKYEKTKKSKYIISATKYYSDSINYFDRITMNQASINKIKNDKFKKENAHINLRMVLYPDAGMDEPIIYEDFPLDFMTTM